MSAEHNTQKKPTLAHAARPERTGLDTEWCAERASDALRWLAVNFPECSGSEALHPHQGAAHTAAVAGDEAAYLEALRGYCRAGRSVALGARRGAA